MRSKFRIEFSENKDVAEAFSTAEPGDEMDIEATIQLSTVTPKYAEGDVVEVRLPEENVIEGEGEGTEGEEPRGPVVPTDNTPVGMSFMPPTTPPIRMAE